MKQFLLPLLLVISLVSKGQRDSLNSGVYHWKEAKAKKINGEERKQLLQGNTLDLSALEADLTTLKTGQASSSGVHPGYDQLIVVKEGKVKLTGKDSAKMLGPGGLAFIVAGDSYDLKNAWDKPSTYYTVEFKPSWPEKDKARSEGSFIIDWPQLVTEKTDKGERRSIFDMPSSLFGKFEMHSTSLNPGVASHDPHRHRAEEIILMIKGNVQMQIGQEFFDASGGDLIFLGSNILHALKNTGTEQCSYFAIQWLK